MTLEGSPARPGYRTVVTLAAGATFLSILDATIANLAVTDLASDFPEATATGLTWVVSLYAILFAACLAPAGRFADVVGRRTLYLAGVGLFTASSLLCAIAPNLTALLVARALQGIGAAAMIPASLSVLLADVPAARRGAAIGIWSAAASAAAAAGPSLGGLLIEFAGWRAVFLINVPIGVALLWRARVVAKSGSGAVRPPDLLGTALLALGVGGLTLGVTQGPDWGWSAPGTLAVLAAGALLLGLALLRSRRHPVPAVQVDLWRHRTFALANAVSLFFGAALYAWLLVGALIMVHVWKYDWFVAGLAMSPGAVLSAVVAVLVGRGLARRGPDIVVVVGAVAVAGAGVWLAVALTETPQFLALWLPVGLLAGFGMGAISTAVSSAAALSVEPTRFAGATGLNMAVRQVGGALGIAALAALMPREVTGDPAAHVPVLLFCSVAVAVAGVLGFGLRLRAPAAAPPPAAVEADTA